MRPSNENILKICIKALKSRRSNEVYDGIKLAAYLVEQAFKSELRKINPLLYFDRKNISDKTALLAAEKKMSSEELFRQKTCSATQCISAMTEYSPDLKSHAANIKELFVIRNFILHSTDDFSFEQNAHVETAVSALRACRKYITKNMGISSNEFNPLTTSEFEELQRKEHGKRINGLKAVLKKHKKRFNKLNPSEVKQKNLTNLPTTDNTTWIEETQNCPACKQPSFDKIGTVDFDWPPEGMDAYGKFYYQCRVCELELSEYEYELTKEDTFN